MKKFLLLLLAFSMVLSLCACGDGVDIVPEGSNGEEIFTEDNGGSATPAETVEKVEVDLTADNTIMVEGKQYALPMSLSLFMEDGWNDTYNHKDETIDAGKGLQYPAFTLDKNGEQKISGIGVYNHTDEEIGIKDGALISLKLVGIPEESRLSTCSFVLPGGITEESTYEDVLACYGTKNESEHYRVADDYESKSKDAENFKKYGFTVLYRSNDTEKVPYNYQFAFNADKTIKYVEVSSADYKSAAEAAFSN